MPAPRDDVALALAVTLSLSLHHAACRARASRAIASLARSRALSRRALDALARHTRALTVPTTPHSLSPRAAQYAALVVVMFPTALTFFVCIKTICGRSSYTRDPKVVAQLAYQGA